MIKNRHITNEVIKKSEFPPSDWEYAKLGNITNLRKQPVSLDEIKDIERDVRYVGLEHLESGNPRLWSWSNASKVKSTKNTFFAGDVLYGKLRPYLDKAVLAEWEGICSTDILVLKPSKRIISEYLAYHLHIKPFVRHAISTTSGTNHPRTSWSALSEYSFYLPTIYEQQKIAYTLSTIQQAIEATDKVITAAQELKKSLMQHLFTYGPVSLEEAEQISFKETEVGILPEHWEVVNLGNIANVKGGKRLPKGHEFSDVTTPYPYLRVLDFKNNSIDISNLKYLTYDDYEAIKNYTITSNDIYISIAGTIGLVGLIPEQLGDANLTENAAKIVIQNPKGINNKFLMFFLVSPKGQRQIKSFSTKTSQPKLALTRIRQIMVALPPLSEQTDISDVLQKVMWKIEREENKKYVLQSLFNSMLHNLMTGKLRVNDLDLNIPEEVAQ